MAQRRRHLPDVEALPQVRVLPGVFSTVLVSTDQGLWSNGTTPAWRAGNAGSTPAGSAALPGGTSVDAEYLNGRKLFVIPQFLTPEECETFIERSEQLGYADAPINTSFGPLVRT